MVTIRNETEADYPRVEDLTRRAFYNLYVPGCHEHYLVHIMRDHRDFLPELSFVLELDGEIAGSILYTRASLEGKNGQRKDILTFGPLCVAPERQRQGYGKALIEHSFAKARALGWEAVVPVLQTLSGSNGGRQLPHRHAGQRAAPRRSGRRPLGLPGQSRHADRRGGRPAL